MCFIAIAFLLFISILVKALHLFPKYDDYSGEECCFCGKIIDKSSNSIYLKSAHINDFTGGLIIYLSAEDTDKYANLRIGSEINGRGKLYSFDEAENFGQFNAKEYYYIRGYNYRVIDVSISSCKASKFQLPERLWQVKQRIKRIYLTYLEEKDAGILAAIMLADKTELDPEIKSLYQISGIAHILSLSGLHIATLGMTLFNVILRLLRLVFGRSRMCDDLSLGGIKTMIVAGIISSVIMFLYCLMTGMNVSSLRALCMFALGLIGRMLKRSYDLLSAAALSSVLAVAINPLYIYDAGFQLSFMAVVSIGVVLPVLNLLFNKFENSKIIQSILLSISIMLGTLPISAYHYYQISLGGILLNIIVVPLMGAVLLMGCIMAIIGVLVPVKAVSFLLKACAKITHVILKLYEHLSSLCADRKWNTLITGKPLFIQVMIYYCLVAIMLITIRYMVDGERGEQSVKKYKVNIDRIGRPFTGHKKFWTNFLKRLILCGILMLTCVILLIGHREDFAIRNLSVGQGDCTVIQNKSHVIIVDCGSTTENQVGTYRLVPSLKANAFREIDAVFISHFDSDHVNGILELLNDRIYNKRIGRFIISKAAPVFDGQTETYRMLMNSLITCDIPIYTVEAGDSLVIGDCIIECLSPFLNYDYESTNSASLVISVLDRVSGRRALLTGDIDACAEKVMTDKLASFGKGFDYLKIAHHGSESSTTEQFLDFAAGNNGYCVISVGKGNRYGHPSDDTLKRLYKYYPRSHILRTDINHETLVRFR